MSDKPPFNLWRWLGNVFVNPNMKTATSAPNKITTPAGVTVAGAMPDQYGAAPQGGERMMDIGYKPPEVTASSLIKPGEDIRVPLKTGTDVSQARVMQYLLARFNPIRGLTPRLLSNYLEQYDLGFVRWMALVFNKIRERDDAITAAFAARDSKVADMGWQIVAVDESPEALQHKQALEEFYSNLAVTHVLDQNTKGGVSLMIRQMQLAVGDKFAVHEIVWIPSVGPDGKASLTAELRYVPLWFFENRTGQLRFLPYDLAMNGLYLEPGGWMVSAVQHPLFPVLSILYLYKQMGLKNWVAYMDKFAIPFLHAKTQADYQSTEWNNLVSAMQGFANDGGIVTKATTELNPIVMGSAGDAPHEPFCDRMDRAMARVIRGGDLSSMSRGHGSSSGGAAGSVGSNPQMENEDMLAKADAERITETCNFYLDRWVINYRFGDGVQPKARFAIQPPQELDTQRELLVDQALIGWGFPMSLADLAERYERPMADPDETLAMPPAKPTIGAGAVGDDEKAAAGEGKAFGNVSPGVPRRFYTNAAQLRAEAQAKALAPLRAKLEEAANIPDPAARHERLEAIRRDLPRMLAGSVTPQVVEAFDSSLAAAMVNGSLNGARQTGHAHSSHPRA